MGGYFGKLNMYAGKFLRVNCKSKTHMYSRVHGKGMNGRKHKKIPWFNLDIFEHAWAGYSSFVALISSGEAAKKGSVLWFI